MKKIEFNMVLKEDWLLKAQDRVVADLIWLAEHYPAGEYVVGIHACKVQAGYSSQWSYQGVALKVPWNVSVAYPFYAGRIVIRAEEAQVA